MKVWVALCLGLLVACGPSEAGRVASEDSRERTSLALAGASVVVQQTSRDFGNQRVGTSGVNTVRVMNTGTATARITSVVISGGAEFTVSPSAPFDLAAGAMRDLSVTFRPTVEGPVTGNLTLTTDAEATPSVTVSLAGKGVKPNPVLNPSPLDFGTVRMGNSATKTVTVTNTGSGSLTITSVSSGSTPAFSMASAPTLPFTLAAGQALSLTVRFSPTAEGNVLGTLTLSTSDPDFVSLNVSLGGTGVQPILQLFPNALAFGEQYVGTSVTRLVQVRNSGSGPLGITSVSIAGSTFTVTPSTGFVLAAGATRELTVAFTPPVEMTFGGALTLNTDDPVRPSATVHLSGTGVKPMLEVTPNSLVFADQRVATTSTSLLVRVRNNGTSTLVISNVALSSGSPFTVSPATSFSLPAGAFQELSVNFTPTVEGSVTGTLTLTTNDPVNPSFTVPLAGRGVRPMLEVFPTNLEFGAQRVGTTSATQVVSVRNTGSGPVSITGVSITAGRPFAVSSTAAFVLMPGTTQELAVTFSPTAVGAATASLTLSTDDATQSVVTVPLAGTGVSLLELSPSSVVDFGQVLKGTTVERTVTLTNTSAAPVRLTAVSSLAAPFSVGGLGVLPVMIAANSSLVFKVGFSPTSTGQYDTSLTLVSDATNSPHTLRLTGSATVVQARLSLPGSDGGEIASLDFRGVRVGTTKQLTVRLTNTGTAPLVLNSASLSSSAFAYLGPSSFTLAPSTSIDFQVSFSPSSALSYSDTLVLRSNAENSPTALSLTGFGAFPELRVERTSVSFGDVRVGDQSARVPVTLANTGNIDVTLQNLNVEGPFDVIPPAGFTLPKVIPAATSLTFEAVFKPAAEGAAAGSVTFVSDVSPLTVAFSGNGTVAQMATSVSSLDFGAQRMAMTSESLPLVISNPGTAVLEITQFLFSNSAFALSAPSEAMPLRIAPGARTVVSVTFTPRALGPAEGQLHIISNAQTAAVPVALKGRGVDGQLSLTPNVVAFSSVEVGSSGLSQGVILTNTGEASLTLKSLTPPADAAFTVSGLPVGTVLQPGATWQFTVSFKPVARGYVSTAVVIGTDSVQSPTFNLPMNGTGVAAVVELQPNSVDFGQSNVGGSTTQLIAIKNLGEKELYVSNIAFAEVPAGGPNAALDFRVGGSVPFPLVVKPTESYLVQLQFTPRMLGLRQAKAIVYTNVRAAEVALQGEGTSPDLVVSSSSLDFGAVVVGRPSALRSLTLRNTGTGPLTLNSLMLGGVDGASFILTTPSLPLTLPPGASTEVAVTFRPEAERSFSAQLVVGSNDAEMPSVVVPMSGRGVRQQIQLSEASLDFGQQLINHTSSPRKLRVINNSDTHVTLTMLKMEGATSSRFTLTSLALPLSLPPGQQQEVGVAFTPLSETEVSGVLSFSFNELSQPLAVALQGKGIPTVLSVKPSPLDFGGVRVGGSKREQPLTVSNLSSDPIVLALPEVTYTTGEPFTYDGASLQGRVLEPGMSLIVSVGYQPLVETLSETTLSFGTTTPPRPRAVEVQLKGRAMQRLLSVDTTRLDFGQVDAGMTVAPKTVTLTNNSSQQQRVVVMLKSLEGTPFSVETQALANPLAPGGTATFSVAFNPQTPGDFQNEAQVWLQGSTSPEVLVPVTGSRADEELPPGCSCGSTEAGSAGMLALLALVGLSSRRRRHA